MTVKKDTDGKRLLKLFSMPRNPTKKDARTRIRPGDMPDEAEKLYAYCDQDVVAEMAVAAECPELEGEELEFYLCDAEMNARGVQIDREMMECCIAVMEATLARYDAELRELTGGKVQSINELAALKEWLATQGLVVDSLDAGHLEGLLK